MAVAEHGQGELFGSDWPIDADKLSERLFRAAASIPPADPFQMRELADAVCHLLHDEFGSQIPSQSELIDSTITCIRELGFPALAGRLHFNSNLQQELAWPDNLFAASDAGVIRFGDTTLVNKIAGGNLNYDPSPTFDSRLWSAALYHAQTNYGQFVAVDGEQLLRDRPPLKLAVNRLVDIRRSTQLNVVANLNQNIKSRAEPVQPSLFEMETLTKSFDTPDAGVGLPKAAYVVLPSTEGIHWRWHLHERDFQRPVAHLLQQICRTAVDIPNWTFVLNRSHQTPVNCHGLHSDECGVLRCVRLDLARFLELMRPRIANSLAFLEKLPSLARLVLEVGHAILNMIRQTNHLFGTNLYVAEQAVLLVKVHGLTEVANQFPFEYQSRFARDGFATTVHQRLTEVLDHDAQGLAVRYGCAEADVSGQVTADLRDSASSLKAIRESILIDPFCDRLSVKAERDQPLLAERLMHLMHSVFPIQQIRAVDIKL